MSLNKPSQWSIEHAVIYWKSVLGALLVFVYPVAAGYCLLENANLVAAVDCCAESTPQDQKEHPPCGGFGCCPIEYAVYSSLDSGVADLIAPPAHGVFLTVVLLTELSVEVPIAQLERAPPEIPRSWQFSCRTALLPRAPSFVS
jgi:hypothetical protein